MPLLDDDKEELMEEAVPVATPSIRDIIAQRVAENDKQLKAVQEQSTKERGLVGVGDALGQIIAGLSRAPETYDSSSYKMLQANANMPVENFLQRQKAKAQAVQDVNAEQAIQDKADSLDPNSTRSKVIQHLMSKYNPKLAETPFAAADANLVQHLESAREMSETRKEIAKGNRYIKQSQDQQRADSELANQLSQLGSKGGNAKYVDALRRAANIEGLLQQYPDLNQMPKDKVNLLFAEIDSMVNSGAPTEAGIHNITPQSVRSKFETLLGSWENKPRGAELGEFMAQTVPYVADVANNARKHLSREHGNLIEGYKGRLSPDAYSRHKQSVEDQFRLQEPRVSRPAAASTAPTGGWTSEKESRLQQLLKKQQEGKLNAPE